MKRIKPKKGQESVWDYPRPPKLEATNKELIIEFDGIRMAATNAAFRVLETSHPPVYYIPQQDIQMDYLRQSDGRSSFCEFKGAAVYWDIVTPNKQSLKAAWSYPTPTPRFQPLANLSLSTLVV
jgi:uncharacterized protein (DUF427 family)